MALEVIGAGVSRTGTDSLREALEILGYPSYHGYVFFSRPQVDGPLWERALNGDLSALDPLFEEFSAAVDAPAFCLYDQLLQRYPDAKVILSVRSSQTWLDSYEETVLELPRHPLERHVSPVGQEWADRVIWPAVSRSLYLDVPPAQAEHADLVHGFLRHTDDVITSVPPHRLLVFRPVDGWEPLCHFLGKPIPDVPFPHRNDRGHFRDTIDQLP